MSVTCPTCRTMYPDGTSHCPVDTSALLPMEAFANADPALAPGTMIGEYRIEKKLGEGSFGTVYAGVQPLIGKKVAIKLLHKRMSSEPEIVSRFIDEARAANRIGHRNIIDIFSFGVHSGNQHYFIMEFCEGMTLGQLLQQKKRLTPTEALPILRGIADGLDAAHQAGVTHRDLKPDNVFLVRIKDNQYFPKLLDFGVAKLAKEDGAQQTATGIAIGTPRYMSPEQCRGKKVDHRTDIYALGCVAHEMLTGRPVFEADSTVDLLFQHMSDPPPPMSTVLPNLPPELDAPVLEMLAKRPLGRPTSAGAAIDALAHAIRQFRASKPSIPPIGAATNTSPTRLPGLDMPAGLLAEFGQAIPNPLPPTIPNEPLRTPREPSEAPDSVPITRKSLTDLSTAQAQPGFRAPESGNTTDIASGPVIHSQMPATLASTPMAGPVVDRTPDVKIIGANEVNGLGADSTSLGTVSNPNLSRKNTLIIAGSLALLLLVAILFMRRPEEPTPPVAPELTSTPSQTVIPVKPEPTTITIRATVSPADARILIDGRDVGKSGDALVLPREKKEHAVRIQRQGYEAQTMWVTADTDKQLGPITLVNLTAAASTSTPGSAALSLPSNKAAPTKNKFNKELQKPKELGSPK
jgi:eukaryotic-like serine/threonine-protein kinase